MRSWHMAKLVGLWIGLIACLVLWETVECRVASWSGLPKGNVGNVISSDGTRISYQRFVRRRKSHFFNDKELYDVHEIYYVPRTTLAPTISTTKPLSTTTVAEMDDDQLDRIIRCDFDPTLEECATLKNPTTTPKVSINIPTIAPTTPPTTMTAENIPTTTKPTTTTTPIDILPFLPELTPDNNDIEDTTNNEINTDEGNENTNWDENAEYNDNDNEVINKENDVENNGEINGESNGANKDDIDGLNHLENNGGYNEENPKKNTEFEEDIENGDDMNNDYDIDTFTVNENDDENEIDEDDNDYNEEGHMGSLVID